MDTDAFHNLVAETRSCRRFRGDTPLLPETLRNLVDLARLSPSGGNLQPLKFVISADPDQNERIYPHLAWAGYLKKWDGPRPSERPTGYIVILGDTSVRDTFGCDHGIAAQSMMLGAKAAGLGCCMVGAVHRNGLRAALGLPHIYEILLVLALGHPAETIVVDEVEKGGDIKYWRDEAGVHHVPKRRLDDVIVAL